MRFGLNGLGTGLSCVICTCTMFQLAKTPAEDEYCQFTNDTWVLTGSCSLRGSRRTVLEELQEQLSALPCLSQSVLFDEVYESTC